ncbi:MAG: hypothetical protein ACK4VN_02275 [Bacteroidales bacterium]
MKNQILHYQSLFLLLFLISMGVGLNGCREKDFIFDLEHLTGTVWGIPQVIEPGQEDPILDAPTVFSSDGIVSIGPNRFDVWSVRGDRSIYLEQARENWFIIKLNADTLYVEKTRLPGGTFLGKFMYNPMIR